MKTIEGDNLKLEIGLAKYAALARAHLNRARQLLDESGLGNDTRSQYFEQAWINHNRVADHAIKSGLLLIAMEHQVPDEELIFKI